jgi:iron complex outermembrane receptor protein
VVSGAAPTTGVINIITRSAGRRPNAATVSGRMSSYSTSETLLSADYFGTTAGFSVNASNFESDGYRSNNRNRQSNFLGDFRFKTGGGDVSLKLAADRQGLRLPGARQVQPSAGVNQLLTDRRGAQTPLDYTQRDGNRASLDWRQPVAFGEFIIGAGWRDKEQTSYFDFGGFPDYRIADLDVWSFTPRVKIGLPAMAAGGTLIAGMDWHRWGYRLRRSNSPRNITAPFNTIDATQENIAWYAFNTVQLTERLTAVVGARTERFKADASDRHDPAAPGGAFGSGAPAGSQRESERAYEVGARYELFPGLALTGKTTRSYRFANVDEIYETSPLFTNEFQFLRPQTARAYEAGIEVRGAAGFARAALFTMDVRDEIHLDAYTTGIGNTNLPPSRRRGLELEGRWTPAERLTLGAAYTHIDARFLQGLLPGAAFTQTNVLVAGKTVPLVPRHKLNANASWALDARTRLNAIATYVGKQFMDNDEGNTLGAQIPSYAVVDFKLVHRHGPWTLSAALNNAFNEKYFNYAVRSQFVADRYNAYPLPERNGTLTVEYALR